MTKNRLRYPAIEFSDNVEDRMNFLLFTAFNVANRFYQRHGFLVLPHKIYATTKTVLLPNIEYPQSFWKLLLKSGGRSVGQNFPAPLKKMVGKNMLSLSEKGGIEKFWKDHAESFWQAIDKSSLFDDVLADLKSVKIILSEYGPGGAFYFTKKGKKTKLAVAFRVDRKPEGLFKSLLSGMILIKNGKPQGSEEKFWKNYYLSEFLYEELGMDIDKNNQKILPTPAEMKAGKDFLNKLGFGEKPGLRIIDNTIFLKEKNLSRQLSPQENLLLTKFLLQRGHIFSHEEIADILWGENASEKYSLWAVSKLIEKLRKKLEKNGVPKNIISSVYRKGYFLEA